MKMQCEEFEHHISLYFLLLFLQRGPNTVTARKSLSDMIVYTGCGKNSMPKLREVRGGIKTEIYCQETIRETCVIAVPRTITVGLTKTVNQAKPLMFSEKEL